MLFTFDELLPYLTDKVKGVIHVGAHMCQESIFYNKLGLQEHQTVWIEANPEIYHRAKENFPHFNLINALCTDQENQRHNFMITSNEGESSSIFEFGTHLKHHPHVQSTKYIELISTTINKLNEIQNFQEKNMMNIDVQGAELLVLKGSTDILNNIDFLYLEVNVEELYKGACLMSDIDNFLDKYGFKRVCTKILQFNWGDALYVKV
jgi:FkbM family methyltransferase